MTAGTAVDAITITTDQIKSWGLVGGIIIIAAAAILIKLVKGIVGRSALMIVGLLALFVMWQSHVQIEQSLKDCDPHILFVHLQISDPSTLKSCQQTVSSATTPTTHAS